MSVYAIIASSNPGPLGAAIAAQYGAAHFQFDATTWFISDGGSSRSISDKLGLSNGSLGSQGIIVKVTGYAGYARSDTWTWLQQFPEAVSNG